MSIYTILLLTWTIANFIISCVNLFIAWRSYKISKQNIQQCKALVSDKLFNYWLLNDYWAKNPYNDNKSLEDLRKIYEARGNN